MTLKKDATMDSPIADSEAATSRIKKAHKSPNRSSMWLELYKKSEKVAKMINSKDINKEIKFLLLITIPVKPIIKIRKKYTLIE